MKSKRHAHLWVLLSFAAISIIVTWPLILNFNTGIPFGGDGFQFIWNGWWYAKASADPNLDVWWTPYQYAPTGSPLITHDFSPLNAYFQSKLSPLLGIFGAHNTLILLNNVLGAWGAYILAWYLTGNRPGSYISGVIYGFSTYHAMHLAQLSTVSSGWIPLYVYYAIKFIRDGGWRDGLFAILTLIACALTHPYNAGFAVLLIFLFMLIGQVGLRKNAGGRKRWMQFFIPILAVLLLLSGRIIDGWNESETIDQSRRAALGGLFSIDPLWLLTPSPENPILGTISKSLTNLIPQNPTEGIVSIGFIASVLGIGSWFRKDATTRTWCWIGLILFLLALGPAITLAGNKTGIPGPYKLWSLIPGISFLRIPARFVGPFTLALAISAAGFVAGLSKDWRKGLKRAFLNYVVPAIIILETLIIPIPISGREFIHPELVKIDSYYKTTTGSEFSPDLAVNFPILPPQSYYLLQQTIHDIPTVDSELSNPNIEASNYFLNSYVYPLDYWKKDVVGGLGVDVILFHPKIAEMVYPTGIVSGTETITPYEMFKNFGYTEVYRDDDLVIFIP